MINFHPMFFIVQENRHRCVLISYFNVSNGPELEDLIYFGRSTCWHDQSPRRTKLVAKDWRD